MSTPNTKRLRLWADALCSGKYKQGKNRLRTPEDTYCCLGVACDLVDPTKWKDTIRAYDSGWEWGEESAAYDTPKSVHHWFGIPRRFVLSDIAALMDAESQAWLPELNDEFDWTFEEIAMLIYFFCEAIDAGDLVM